MSYKKPMADEGVINVLLGSIKSNTNTHAYLFEGEKGLQKRETASYFAAALLCENYKGVPCGECESCIQALGGNNPDIKRMSLSDITDKKSIGADDVRSIISDVYTRPFKASKKVYILEDGDALTVQAQNALLKVLEEPPSYAVFIICVSNGELILPTVRSRTRSVRFISSSDKQIIEYVKEKYPNMANRAEFVASFAGGALGRADFICSDELAIKMRAEALEFVKVLLEGRDEDGIFKMCDIFEEYKKDKNISQDTSQILLDFMLSYFKDILYISGGIKDKLANNDQKDVLMAIASKTSYERVYKAISSVMETKQMLSRYVSHKAVIMKLALDIFYID